MSTSTGPGRPVRAMWKASWIGAGQLVWTCVTRIVVLGAGAGDARDVALLEGVVADEVRRDLSGEDDDRDGVHVGRGDAGDSVRGPGPEVASATPTFPVARA